MPRGRRPEEILGLEHDWLAVDEAGHVGLFSTAGGGLAPRALLEDAASQEQAISALLALPPTCGVRQAPRTAAGLSNTWKEAARRGVYAFDSSVHGGAYRRVGVPVRPGRVGDFADTLAEVIQRVSLKGIRFDRARRLTGVDLVKAIGDDTPISVLTVHWEDSFVLGWVVHDTGETRLFLEAFLVDPDRISCALATLWLPNTMPRLTPDRMTPRWDGELGEFREWDHLEQSECGPVSIRLRGDRVDLSFRPEDARLVLLPGEDEGAFGAFA